MTSVKAPTTGDSLQLTAGGADRCKRNLLSRNRWLLLLYMSLGQLAAFLVAVALICHWFGGNLSQVMHQDLAREIERCMRSYGCGVSIGLVALCSLLNLAFMKRYERRLTSINNNLELMVQRRTSALLKTRDAIIFGLARLADSRDNETGEHLERIRRYAGILVDELSRHNSKIDDDFKQTLVFASSLHDIGKVGIPDAILLKPGKLSPEERAVMQQHTIIGGDCLAAIKQRLGEDDFLHMACEIALAHHERWDGGGYPHGLAGDDIPLSARIVALADHYDALTSKRVYKLAMTHDEARKIIVSESAGQFDPEVVEAFLSREPEFRQISESKSDPEPSAQSPASLLCPLPKGKPLVKVIRRQAPTDVVRHAAAFAQRLTSDLAESLARQTHHIASLNRQLDATINAKRADKCGPIVIDILDANSKVLGQLTSASARLDKQARHMDDLLLPRGYDELTGLLNRQAFEEEIAQRTEESKSPGALLLIAIDDFQQLEIDLGHDTADSVLRAAAQFLTKLTRDNDLLGCYGRGIFSVALAGVSLATALQVAERIRCAFFGSFLSTDLGEMRFTVSIGVADPAHNRGATLIDQAEQALAVATRAGNTCYVRDGQQNRGVAPDTQPRPLAESAPL